MWVLRVWYQELWGIIPFSLVFSASSFSAAYPFQRLIFRISCFESWHGTEN
ncbi:DMSO/TMAO reductase YedYZ molybdopterin-dependent catalytic subunit [Salinibacter ruber]|uniref:DMSO/TMAO reductase YedYZ molybdopterin-dependent catalytic subunit n=1 Tax=Salinibacter ruber TaxID=146919 RepID=A0A9X2U4Z9_9BACT|nr:DMSO/TMAO reductase YedYZ molybdopterin-dependent catalytic subunit [Salinibacter ruber]MCS3866837.1 DMSO/TMAO reductase YedYZ molybdopterin-dependent catalytic subunit [Salinibacter ruber]MCS4191283.1 DMSO/TMAO reductase YedYZ molybdopterin-dependent catalytic subunit [Salinibacter ruber]